MPKGVRAWLIPLLVLLPAGSFGSPTAEEREAELERVRERIEALRAQLDTDRSRYDALRGELKSAEQRIGKLAGSLDRLEDQLRERRERLTQLKGEQRRLERKIGTERELLAQQVRSAYMAGRQEFVKMLLNQEDPASVGRVTAYYDYLNKARSQRIEGFLDTLTALEAVRQRIDSETARLAALQEQQHTELEQLEQAQSSRNVVLLELRAELRTKDQQLDKLLGDKKELEAVIQVLREALEDIPAGAGMRAPFKAMKGKMSWPANGKLATRFGARHKLGDIRWRGVLIQAAEGDAVRTVSRGRVAYADWLRGYGLLMIIDHGDGFMSLYAHNRSLLKETGDWVEAGEIIANVGRSGGRDESGLYFEIRKDGEPINPALWCRNVN